VKKLNFSSGQSTKVKITNETKEIGSELFQAIIEEDCEILEEILSTGLVDVNELSSDGQTPLHLACDQGSLQIV
jgi:ankyrin repeat protein